MGLDRAIQFPTTETPAWETIRKELARVGEEAHLRMIDGLPAFPDETPEPEWKELRVGTQAGMITLRRGSGVLTCVIWGNADEDLTLTWGKFVWACAVAGNGLIELPTGKVHAVEFATSLGLLPT